MTNKKNYIIPIICLTLIVIITTCELPRAQKDESAESWTIEGTAAFSTLYNTWDTSIKLAAFYTGTNATITSSSTLISTVEDLGSVSSTKAPFTLTITPHNISPQKGHYILLALWLDENNDDLLNIDSEQYYNAVPNKTTNCPCFGTYDTTALCSYYYDTTTDTNLGTNPGWNQRTKTPQTTTQYTPLTTSPKTNATIQSDGDFTNNPPPPTTDT